jgi:ribonucleoside-diphosphate reductase alpha chain
MAAAIEPAEQVTFGFSWRPRAANALDAQLGEMMGDAPMCDKCGHITCCVMALATSA